MKNRNYNSYHHPYYKKNAPLSRRAWLFVKGWFWEFIWFAVKAAMVLFFLWAILSFVKIVVNAVLGTDF